MSTQLYQIRINNATTPWEKAFWTKKLQELLANQYTINAIFNRII